MKKHNKYLLYGAFAIYILALLFITYKNLFTYSYFPNGWLRYVTTHTNLIPFGSITFYIKSLISSAINTDIAIYNIIFPIVIFIPLGIFLPLLFKKTNKLGVLLLLVFAFLTCLNILKVATMSGSFDIDDIILGILGAGIGYGFLYLSRKLLLKHN